MNAGMSVGRLGPLAAALGVGAALLVSGSGVASADSADPRGASAASMGPRGGAADGPTTGPARATAAPSRRATRVADGVRTRRDRAAPSAAAAPAMSSSTLTTTVPRRRAPSRAPGAARDSRDRAPGPAAVAAGTGQPSARAVGTDPVSQFFSGLAAFFNNQTPRLNPEQVNQNPAGVVTGLLNAVDPDSPRLTFTVTGAPAHGSAVVGADGTWAYTPRPDALVAGITDSFRVTVSDAASGFAIHGLAGLLNLLTFGLIGERGDSSTSTVAVTVAAVGPANSPPRGSYSTGTPDPVTGAVTGLVTGVDADGDPLNYTAPPQTGRGAVTLDSVSGAFRYTPTTSARQNAAAPGAGPAELLDGFTVTIADGRGGIGTIDVTVPILPAATPGNHAPTGTVSLTGTDPTTGVVTGAVLGADVDGDTLSYSGSTTTGKGAVVVFGTGAFSYTPTALARQNAAAPGALPAALQDVFTVTIADGRGGIGTVDVTVPILPAAAPLAPLAAFAGAEGFGATATGGRGGTVLYVTNLNADGPGSLQWAIDQPGARYVLFTVSGMIDAQIHLTNGDVTIAGQTSPGGITVRGFVTDETPYQDQTVRTPDDFAENWILQHIRIRPGATGPSDDGLRLRYTRNAIVDHVSIGNATDEAIEISYSNNITIQNTIIAETVGGHSFYGGVLMNYSNPTHGFGLDNVSLHHNVFNRIEGRLPEGSRESAAAAGSFMNLELSNNLYWDPRFFIALGVDTAVAGGRPIYWKLNAVNNFFHTASSFPFGMFDDQILNVGGNELFVSGNRMSLYPARSDYELFYCCNDYPSETSPNATSRRAQARTERHPFPAITYTPTEQLRTVLLNTAGAWPRDPMDTRLMQSVASNTIAGAPPNTNPAGDALLPAYNGTAPAAPTDTDGDGMPDVWESVRGLDPAVANTNAHTLSPTGYNDLEVYLQQLSAARIAGVAL